ncbi:MAG: hypothetical protein M3N98_01990 [Actinomycetota bacterium]|nr:hypothetical protein [Actinomycetota bacterium]
MDDKEVIGAFVSAGSRNAFGPLVHVERNVLLLSGWWHVALRVAPDTFIVRSEDPPFECSVIDDLVAELRLQGLEMVGSDLPAIQPIVYAELSLGGSSFDLWAPDLASGERLLAARVSEESFLSMSADESVSADFSAELGGARRVAGLPPAFVLAIGLPQSQADQLQRALPNCRFEATTFTETAPSVCGTLLPALVLIDATGRAGREFIMELRTEACGRFVPVAALTTDELPLGADIALDPSTDPGDWVESIRALLP